MMDQIQLFNPPTLPQIIVECHRHAAFWIIGFLMRILLWTRAHNIFGLEKVVNKLNVYHGIHSSSPVTILNGLLTNKNINLTIIIILAEL